MSDLPSLDRKRVISDVYSCSRCSYNHSGLTFIKFDRPIVDTCNDMKTIWDFWAICPVSLDPILLRQQPVPQVEAK